MKVSELYKAVAQLGFEDSLESDERFIYAANRALLQVSALRPATGVCTINHRVLDNMICEDTLSPVAKTDVLIFEAQDVRAYYFEADGNGTAHIELFDAEEETWKLIGDVSLDSNGAYKAYRGFIRRDGNFVEGYIRLKFTGEYLYSVKNVAMYRYVYSNLEKDIPEYGAFARYDISALVDDFLSLASPPIQEASSRTYLNQGYDVENGRVLLFPKSESGVYQVIYNRKPTPISVDTEAIDNEDDIDLDEELCALLPVLIASYIWMDDEPEKAEYYLMLYRERAADIERRIISTKPVNIKSVNGW